MECLHVFIDESGDEHLNVTSGASRNYVLAAVMVRDEATQSVIEGVESVRRRYFQTGEMKSSGIGSNVQRRCRVLQALSELDFHVVAFCVPKLKLESKSPLKFGSVFLKYTANRLCMHLPRAQEIRVTFDSKGRAKFKDEFKSYLVKRFPRNDLFRSLDFKSADSKVCLLVQAADIYAGSIAKQYELQEVGRDSELLSLLSKKTTVWEWPANRDWGCVSNFQQESEFDIAVRREASRRAWTFLETQGPDINDVQLKCVFLKWLIDHSVEDDQEFMLAEEILGRFRRELGVELDSQALRNRVVGPLRDADILIASSSKGYRLPVVVRDIQRYVDLCSSQIPPALARLRRAREIIRRGTSGKLDILADSNLHELRAAVDATSPIGVR
jgi:hypothetical protein